MQGKDLYKVGDKVRIKKQPQKGSHKFNQLPFSEEVYEIKEVRIPTRSYVLEITKENRQPLRFFCHHRRCKKVFERPKRLLEYTSPETAENNKEKLAEPEATNIDSSPKSTNAAETTGEKNQIRS